MILSDLPKLPHGPGVYIYKNIEGTVLYIGKAINIEKRVKQYFQKNNAIGAKTKLLVSQIATIETIQTASEFDALLLEAKLIYQYKPKYNVIAKDDKSPLYVHLTLNEELPRIMFVRRPRQATYGETYENNAVFFGPFQSAKTVRWVLANLRRVIPYCTQKVRNGKPCFYTHIGLCAPCPSVLAKLSDSESRRIQVKIYRHNIFRLRDVLAGKGVDLRQKLEKEMQIEAKNENFEKAARIRDQLQALISLYEKRVDPMLYMQNAQQLELASEEETHTLYTILKPYYPNILPFTRVECIDISNTQGTFATGSLVVFTNGIADKQHYKRFRIKQKQTPNDFAMIKEVVERRLKHPQWPYPQLLVIDGGKGQVQAAVSALSNHTSVTSDITVIGLAKRREEIIVQASDGHKKIILPYDSSAIHLLQRIRDEAHRFALAYHRLLRKKAL